MLSDEMSKRAYELTGLENPNSVSQLKSWLEDRGIEVESLGKKDVAAMISDLDKNSCDQEALDMLKLRLQMAKSSVKKYQAAERCVCADGRARGLFQFYGANRTGRWAGRLVQVQNLPAPTRSRWSLPVSWSKAASSTRCGQSTALRMIRCHSLSAPRLWLPPETS